MKKSNFNRSIIDALGMGGVLWLTALVNAPPTLAAPDITYMGAYTYKDAKDNVYYVTTTSKVDVVYDNVDVIRTPYSDACGFTRLSLNESSSSLPITLTFNGASDSLGSIPSVGKKSIYKCVNGVAQWTGTVQTGVFQTSVTNVDSGLTTKNIYYPPARTGGASRQGLIAYTARLTKYVNPNACGFILTPGYANSQKKTSGTLAINGMSINIAGLPVNPSPPECVGGKTLIGNNTNVATFNGNSLYRTSKAIYFAGLTPNSLNVVDYDALQSKSFAKLGDCGLFKITYKDKFPTSIRVGAINYTPATMTGGSANWFYCGSSNLAGMSANTLYKYDQGTFFYKVTDLTQKKIEVETPIVVSKNIAVNACGFAVIPSLNIASGFTTGDKVTINGSAPYDVTALPLATEAPRCKNGAIYLVSP
jgi:hypothetical protein